MDAGRQILNTFFARHRLDAGTFATMGLGVGYAIAAQLHDPSANVVAVLGDSALGFSAMELETAARFRLPITVLCINNNGIYSGVTELPGPEGKEPPKRIPPTALSPNTRYELLIEALGGKGFVAATPNEVTRTVKEAMEYAHRNRVPTLVNILIETNSKKPIGKAATAPAPKL